MEISYVLPTMDTVVLTEDFVGQTYGKSDIKIIPRVEGNVLDILFTEGTTVQAGTPLYRIDPITYTSKVQEAKGNLESARSELVRAEAELRRIRPLAQLNAVSQRDLDDAIAKVNVAKARVSSMEAMVQQQNIKLGYCTVEAPVSGVIGISAVKVGDYVAPFGQQNILNTISDVSEIRVKFTLTENKFLEYTQKTKSNSIAQTENIQLQLSDQSIYPYTGKISIKDRSLDPTTGTLTVEALFPNPQRRLIPGQFVRLKVPTGVVPNAISLPERAVMEMQGIYQVYIINDKNVLEIRTIQVREAKGGTYIVTSGLTGKEKVALIGSAFVRPGMPVQPIAITSDSIQ